MERNLLVAGFGGQGVMMLGTLLAQATCESTDKHVTYFPSYGAEMRGGTANCYVVISDDEIGAPVMDEMEDMIIMNDPSLNKFIDKLKSRRYPVHQQLHREVGDQERRHSTL